MVTCFTGHRPDKLKGYDPNDNKQLLWRLHKEIVNHIENKNVDTFITGMALGIDMWAGRIVLKIKETYPNIKLICAIPCLDHCNKWREESKKEWKNITSKADRVHYVTEDLYTSYCMQQRNIWMVNSSDFIIAVWDGSKGGTGNCVKYGEKNLKEITQIKP